MQLLFTRTSKQELASDVWVTKILYLVAAAIHTGNRTIILRMDAFNSLKRMASWRGTIGCFLIAAKIRESRRCLDWL